MILRAKSMYETFGDFIPFAARRLAVPEGNKAFSPTVCSGQHVILSFKTRVYAIRNTRVLMDVVERCDKKTCRVNMHRV